MQTDLLMAAAAGTYVQHHAPVLAVCLDTAMTITAANAHAHRVLGSELVGTPFVRWILGFTESMDLHALTAAHAGPHRLGLTTAAGMPETFYFHFYPLPQGTLALGCLDFREQEHLRNEALALNRQLNDLARQLHQTNAELKELNQLKNQFLGMAAHDLRNPVGGIMIYAQFLLDEAASQLSPEQQGFLRTVLQSAAGMKHLIDDFLDVAMIESGHLRLDLSPTTVEEIFAPVVELGRLMAAPKQIALMVSPADGPRRLPVDRAKLQQVLLNLIGNAVDHASPGQRVWLSTTWEPQALRLSVRDEGPGLTAEDQQRLFAPFERLPTRRTTRERHAGLGLTIAHRIVEAHHGTIRVESTPGQGATFIVTLPAAWPSHPHEPNPETL